MRAEKAAFAIMLFVLLAAIALLAGRIASNADETWKDNAVFFAYGANLDPSTMKSRAGGFLFAAPARLEGYALEFSSPEEGGFGVANAVRKDGSSISGAIYIFSNSQFAEMRKNSGGSGFYTTEKVSVSAIGGIHEAEMLVLRSKGATASPSRPYVFAMRRGIASFWGEEEAADEIESAYAGVLAQDAGA